MGSNLYRLEVHHVTCTARFHTPLPLRYSDRDRTLLVSIMEQPDQKPDQKPDQEPEEEALKQFTWEEVQQHNNSSSLWIVIHGKVYDVTKFMEEVG